MDHNFKDQVKLIKRTNADKMSETKKLLFFLIAILISVATFSQDTTDKTVGMADEMRSNGRIYVVVAVMLTILAGLIFYVARLDRKISKLEKKS